MQQKYSFNEINFYQKRKTYGKILFFIPKSNCYNFAWIFFRNLDRENRLFQKINQIFSCIE